MEENKELNELRNQIAVLKQKLTKQEIVNDRMLRQAMQTTVDNVIKRVEVKTLVCGVFAMLIWPGLYFTTELRLPFCLYTCLMVFCCIVATVYFNRPIHKTDLMSADLATVAKELARFKRRHDLWLRYVTPTLIIPWLAWTWYECSLLSGVEPFSKHSLIIGTTLLVGAIVGGAIGYTWHRKAVNTAQSLIKQIEE